MLQRQKIKEHGRYSKMLQNVRKHTAPEDRRTAEGKLSGLFCAALCATIVHSELHTHMNMNRPNSSLDWVLSHWAHSTVVRFIFVYVLFCA